MKNSNTNFLFIILLLFITTEAIKAADRYWVCNGGNRGWGVSGNWSTTSGGAGGSGAPGATDNVYFDANGTADPNGESAFTTTGSFTIAAGYTGTMDFGSNNFSVGSFSQSGGTFIMGAGTFDVTGGGAFLVNGGIFTSGTGVHAFSGSFTLSGGTYNATSGNTSLAGNFTETSGTFTHSSGTFIFDGASTQNFNIANTVNFYDVQFNMGNSIDFAIASADIISILHDATFTNGTINAETVAVSEDATFASTWDGGAFNLKLSGSASTLLDLSGATAVHGGNITVDKTNPGVVVLQSDVTLASAATLTLTARGIDINGNILTINNTATNAISATSGYLEFPADANYASKLKWVVNSVTGNRVIPFGLPGDGTSVGIQFNLTSGNMGTAEFSTYPDADYNPLPVNVDHISNNDVNTCERFWYIGNTGASSPVATIKCTYSDPDIGSNGEATYNLQSWNDGSSIWNSATGSQTFTAGTNTVEAPGVSAFNTSYGMARTTNPLGAYTPVTRYWVGPAGGNWNTTANWSTSSGGASGASVPISLDNAIFDGGDVDGMTLASAFTINNLTLASGYSGTITCGANNLTVNGVLTVTQGTLNSGSNTTDLNGDLIINGGTFSATSGNTTLAGDYFMSSGTFTHSGGTFIFDAPSAQNFRAVSLTPYFNNLTVDLGDNGNLTLEITEGNSYEVDVMGTLTLNNGNILATNLDFGIEVNGGNGTNFVINSGFDNASTARVEVLTDDASTVTIGNVNCPSLKIGGTSGNSITVDLSLGTNFTPDARIALAITSSAAHTLNLNGADITIDDLDILDIESIVNIGTGSITLNASDDGVHSIKGTLNCNSGQWIDYDKTGITASGTFNASTDKVFFYGEFKHDNGGTFNHNNGTVVFGKPESGGTSWLYTGPALETYYNVDFEGGNGQAYTLTTGDQIKVLNNLSFKEGALNSATNILAEGNVSVLSAWDGGSAEFEFTGTNAQTFTLASAIDKWVEDITINKTGGDVTLGSDLTMSAGKILTITDGTFNISSYNAIVPTFNVAASKIINVNTGTLTTNGGVSNSYIYGTLNGNSGTVTFDSDLYIQSGGTYSATTGTTTFKRQLDHNNGGTFTHNNGTVVFDEVSGATISYYGPGSQDMYNVNFNSDDGVGPKLYQTINVTNNLTLTDGLFDNGVVKYLPANFSQNANWDGGDGQIEPNAAATISITKVNNTGYKITRSDVTLNINVANAVFDGIITITDGVMNSNNNNITCGGIEMSGGVYNNGSATLTCTGYLDVSDGTFNGGTGNVVVNAVGAAFRLAAGTFTAPATMTVGGDIGNPGYDGFNIVGGTFNHNNGTVVIGYHDMMGAKISAPAGGIDFYNLTLSEATDDLDIFDMVINDDDEIRVNNTLTFTSGGLNHNNPASPATLKALGNVVVSSGWVGGDVELTFSGTAATQTFDLTGAEAKWVEDVIINKSSGKVQLLSNFQMAVGKVLSLTDGELDLNSKKLILTNTAETAIGRTSGYIKSENSSFSSQVKWFMGSTTTNHVVPFGIGSGASNYIPMEIQPTAGDADTITVATYSTADYGALPPTVDHISGNNNSTLKRFWKLDYAICGGCKMAAAPTITIGVVYVDGDVAVDGEDDVKLQQWVDGDVAWASALGGQTSDAVNNKITLPGITSFNKPIAGARSGSPLGVSPLPVELMGFEGNCMGSSVYFEWNTASEVNNDHFELQRSLNGTDYYEVVRVEGEGNSNTLSSYYASDTDPMNGTSYYRLKQVDFNGAYEYSDAIIVSCDVEESFEIYSASYNPEDGSINMIMGSEQDENINVKVFDMNGRTVKDKTIEASQGNNEISLNINTNSVGTYLLRVSNSRQSIYTKLAVY